jgi:hypothetical protein
MTPGMKNAPPAESVCRTFLQIPERSKLRDHMRNLAIALIWASVATFLAAVVLVIFRGQSLIGTGAGGLSRASSNLALIAIALGVWFGPSDDD